MSISNASDDVSCDKLCSDVIPLINKSDEKQPLISTSHSPTKRLDDINPLSSGDEGDDERDSNESDLFRFATSSQVSNFGIGITFILILQFIQNTYKCYIEISIYSTFDSILSTI